MEVAIIGKGPGFESAPLKGEGVVTWGVNDACGHRECDVAFWMDRCWEKGTTQDNVIVASVNHTNTPMYSTQEWDDIPSSVRYPIEELTEYFGNDYWGDSCCYMIALAIWEGFTEISTYGFNYSWGKNYGQEKPPVEFWLGVALGQGVTLNLYGEHCALLKTNHFRHDPEMIYAYGTPQIMERTGIKMGEKIEREEKEFTLDIASRVALMNMWPTKGDFNMLKANKWVAENLFFLDKDREKLNMRQVQDNDGPPYFIWDENAIPDITIPISIEIQDEIAKRLRVLNKEEQLGKEHFDLYEQFCMG
jgi:hypothetical protein